MSSAETVTEASGSISSDRFVEIKYDDVIPNNVALSSDKQLQRALETWRPKYLDWWNDMGPEGFQSPRSICAPPSASTRPAGRSSATSTCRNTAGACCSRRRSRAAPFPSAATRASPPGRRCRANIARSLRRLLVVQGDTEPASVEQQRYLGATAPSLYDMRNLFQVNVEEGRHLWAIVYLLVKYFGKDGREEAEALLERRSGQEDNPRILGAFNERTPDWL